MHGVRRGVLITFEGVEGSGKTTQVRGFVDWLKAKNIPHIYVRDPGGTEVSEAIRKILLDPSYKHMASKCEVLLFLAARSQLTYERIIPALSEKKVVVSDRFFDSTYAYQAFGRDLALRTIAVFNRFATAGIKPDLTFLVDIDVTKARERGVFDDRMETENMLYHEKVRAAYLKLAHRAKKRIKVLNGAKPLEILGQEVVEHATKLLSRKGYKI